MILRETNASLLFFLLSLSLLYPYDITAEIADTVGTVDSSTEASNSKIAPGEFLPISIKLVNFGSEKRIDVVVNYQILDSSGNEVYAESETVAVETTASFVKRIQLPYTLKGGTYIAVVALNYPGQESPAVSRFNFLVEEKIAGFFRNDLFLYAVFIIVIILVVVFITYFFAAARSHRRFKLYDYSNKPKNQIIYYEILSDIISQMRLRIGDDAIKIAEDIPNFKIDKKTGYIVDIGDNPAKITALLIVRYEKLLGHPLSFGVGETLQHKAHG